jgi:hypothetical protein
MLRGWFGWWKVGEMTTGTASESAARWHEVAEQIMAGLYKNPTKSEAEALAIGLRCFPLDGTCIAALRKIDPNHEHRP